MPKQPDELDLADFIDSYLWDECDGEDLCHLESIKEETMQLWESHVRELLEREGVNRYYKDNGEVRKQ